MQVVPFFLPRSFFSHVSRFSFVFLGLFWHFRPFPLLEIAPGRHVSSGLELGLRPTKKAFCPVSVYAVIGPWGPFTRSAEGSAWLFSFFRLQVFWRAYGDDLWHLAFYHWVSFVSLQKVHVRESLVSWTRKVSDFSPSRANPANRGDRLNALARKCVSPLPRSSSLGALGIEIRPSIKGKLETSPSLSRRSFVLFHVPKTRNAPAFPILFPLFTASLRLFSMNKIPWLDFVFPSLGAI